MKNFTITAGKGLHIKFANNYGVSIQFGPKNYCENQSNGLHEMLTPALAGEKGSDNAECAIIDPDGELVHREDWGDLVKGWMTPEEVLKLLNETANMVEK